MSKETIQPIGKIQGFFEESTWKLGINLYKHGKVEISDIYKVFFNRGYSVNMGIFVEGFVKDKNTIHKVQVILTQNGPTGLECDCPSGIYGFYWRRDFCSHLVALIVGAYQSKRLEEIDLYTGRSGMALVNQYTQSETKETLFEKNKQKVSIEPLLKITPFDWKVSFKIGNDKKYVIKNLLDFYERMIKNEEFSYGKDFDFLHREENFEEQSKPYLRFIMERMEELNKVIINNPGTKIKGGREIELSSIAMESLIKAIGEGTIPYNTDDLIGNKAKGNASIVNKNPKFKICISPSFKEESDLEGVDISFDKSYIFLGNKVCYALENNAIVCSDDSFYQATYPLIHNFKTNDYEDISIGKDLLASFYNEVLPRLEKYIKVEQNKKERIQQQIKEKPELKFYFDLNKSKKIICKIVVTQENETLYFLDEDAKSKGFGIAKNKVLSIIDEYVEEYDREKELFVFSKDEQLTFDFITYELAKLEEIGEVLGTDEFLNIHVRRSPKVTIGVQLKSNLLDLSIDTDAFNMDELLDILSSYRNKKKYHRLKDGSFLELEHNALESLVEILDGLQIPVKEFVKGKMNIPAYRALYVDKVLQESNGIEYERNSNFKKIVREFRAVEDSDYEVPKELKHILRTYQKTGYRWLSMLEHYNLCGILADDMGLGKTLQVITLLQSRKERGEKGTSIIITPASLLYNWEKEFSKFAPDMIVGVCGGTKKERKDRMNEYETFDVLITSYDLLRRDIEEYEEMNFDYKIIDEAQYIKNHSTLLSKSVKIIKAKHKLALTGTPIENRLSELWSIFDFLMPGFLYSYDKFKKELEIPIVKNNDEKAVEQLKKMIAPFILRRLKKDVLKDLPEKLEEVTYAKLEEEQMKLYSAFALKMKQELASQKEEDFTRNKIKILSELTKLRQICCDPSLAYENYRGHSAKLETCMELVANGIDGGHKILLFSQFTTMLDIIGKKLEEEKIPYYLITGATPKSKRQELVDQFNENEVPIFLISLKAGGTGLNLTGADIVIHYDPWWNVAAQNQATDRTHRIGQKNVVTVFKIIAKDTIEEKIMKLQESKRQLADQIISGEENKLSTMTQEDFMELLEG